MKPKKYKTKISRSMVEGLHGIIEVLLQSNVVSDDDKLHFSVLAEVKEIMRKRLENVQKDTEITLSPSQAIALRILAIDYITDKTSYTGNRLHQIANEVHKLYQ